MISVLITMIILVEPIGVGTLEIGKQYKIETVGNTDFTLIGAGQINRILHSCNCNKRYRIGVLYIRNT